MYIHSMDSSGHAQKINLKNILKASFKNKEVCDLADELDTNALDCADSN